MSEKSDQRGSEPLQTPHHESTRVGDDSLHTQRDAAQNNAGKEDKIGPGHPPRKSRWKKGDPSPNPKGRPRKDQSMLPDVRKLLEQAMNKKVRVSRGDKKVLMTKLQLSFEQQANQAAKGDRHALRFLMDIAPKVGVDFQAKHKQLLEEALTPNYQAILDDYVARRSGSGNVEPATPVLASAELLDDGGADPAGSTPAGRQAEARRILVTPATAKNDAAPGPRSPLPTKAAPPPPLTTISNPAPPPPSRLAAAAAACPPMSAAPPSRSETVSTPPPPTKPQPARRPAPAQVKAQTAPTSSPPPDPEPEPGKIYPKPFSRMRWTEKRAWYPDWWAKYVTWEAEQGTD